MLIEKAPLPLVHGHSVSYGRFKRRLADFLSIDYWTLPCTIYYLNSTTTTVLDA